MLLKKGKILKKRKKGQIKKKFEKITETFLKLSQNVFGLAQIFRKQASKGYYSIFFNNKKREIAKSFHFLAKHFQKGQIATLLEWKQSAPAEKKMRSRDRQCAKTDTRCIH